MVSVAIDGPAGAGKSTLARRLAADFGYIYVDTGAMFRTIGLYALRAGKDPKDNEAVNALLPNITLEFAFIEGEQHIYLNGEDVSTAIRTEEVGMAASAVGANPAVRAFLLEMQRDMARTQNILMDGRDIGTVVLPNATVKIFLTASPEARATRRWKEYQAKGIDTPYEEVLADVKQRDYQDTHRAAAPLKQADVAAYIEFRLRAAGYHGPNPFTDEAVRMITRISEGLSRRINIIADKATSTNSLELILDLVEQSLDTDPKYRENVRKQAGVTDGMSYMRLVPQDNPKGMLPPTPWGRKAAEEAYRQHQVRQLDQRLRLLRTLATGSYKNHDTPETNDYLALMDFNVGDQVTMGPS